MRRGKFLDAVVLIVLLVATGPATAGEPDLRFGPRAERPPRKVVVGTAIFGPYGEYPGLEKRLAELEGLVDQMAAESARQKPGRGLDLAVLPETVVGPTRGQALERAVTLKGAVEQALGALARKHRTYLVAPMDLREDGPTGPYATNAAVLFDRQGKIAGIYRKAHPVAVVNTDVLESGITPGTDFPVFDCNFGKLGVQICWDMQFPDGWDRLAQAGAEIVVWPTASPATVLPSARALLHRYFVVSSTWRDNATIYEPTGMVAARVLPPGRVLVHEIDLSHAILGWSSFLRDGEALREKFGDRVGYHYSSREDTGLFWSNDPKTPIATMIRAIGGEELDPQVERNRRLQKKAVEGGGAAGLKIQLRKPADRAQVEATDDGARVTLTSESGIGSAVLEPERGDWPSAVAVRLKLRGLEALRVSGGTTNLQVSLPSSAGGAARALDRDERALALGAFEADGRPSRPPLGPGGWIEFRIPATLLKDQPNQVRLDWVDFHR